ncbi:aminoglycoside phosphotransferase family protein [Cumulibacter soli]|uniref:aminoglycoside phosphotransferase family protein n=1 Tax=Cumulibacter soli TaxID=2546344 RepID=UPI001068C46B|nr:aminoglycoside phosphotransferase family protein [Cumulibacter soli]
MATPDADVQIDSALVYSLLRQSPEHRSLQIRLAGRGWDNEIWRLGSDLAVRLPRRYAAAQLIEHEIAWLAQIATTIAIAAPVPIFAGTSTTDYPYRWTIVPWLAGTSADHLAAKERDQYAGQLAQTLRRLHRPAPEGLPTNRYRGVPLADRAPDVTARLDDAGLRRLLRDALDAPRYSGPALTLHGDPHPANVIVDAEGRLSALIDFGDVCRGDPASDVGAMWLHFTAGGRREFFDVYGADDALRRRSRGWAISLATAILATDDTHPLHTCALHALHELSVTAARTLS